MILNCESEIPVAKPFNELEMLHRDVKSMFSLRKELSKIIEIFKLGFSLQLQLRRSKFHS